MAMYYKTFLLFVRLILSVSLWLIMYWSNIRSIVTLYNTRPWSGTLRRLFKTCKWMQLHATKALRIFTELSVITWRNVKCIMVRSSIHCGLIIIAHIYNASNTLLLGAAQIITLVIGFRHTRKSTSYLNKA